MLFKFVMQIREREKKPPMSNHVLLHDSHL